MFALNFFQFTIILSAVVFLKLFARHVYWVYWVVIFI